MPCTPTPTLAFRMWWRSRVSAIAASAHDSHRYAARVSSMYPARRGQRKPGASCRHGGCHEETRHFQDAGRRAQGLAALARQRTEGLAVLPDARGAGAPRMGYGERHLLRDRATSRRYVRQPQVLVKNGWLKPMSVRKRAHGEYATQVFRVKEGTVPEKKDRRKGNNPTSARLV